jgi:hypothetical protein
VRVGKVCEHGAEEYMWNKKWESNMKIEKIKEFL